MNDLILRPVERDPHTAEFFEGTARNELLIRQCLDCGKSSEPEAAQCPACGSTDVHWHPASGRGKVVSWVISHLRTGDRSALGIIELDEGPWLWAPIAGDHARLRVDASVRVHFHRPAAGSEALPVFQLVEEAGSPG